MERGIKEELDELKSSPYYEGYMALLKQINKWNEEISKSPTSLKTAGEDDMKLFEKAHKYFTTIDTLYDKLDILRGKMSPEDQGKVDKVKEKELKKAQDQVAI